MAKKPTYEELEQRVKELENEAIETKLAQEALKKRIVTLTMPRDDRPINFEDLFNLEDIQRLQDEFANATGVASIITHTDGTPITRPSRFCRLCNDIIRKTKKGRANCYASDAAIGRLSPEGPTIQPCMSGGLWDAGAGISVGGRHIANWLIGQVCDETQTEDKMRAYALEIGADESALIQAFREVPSMSRERFAQIAQVLFTLSNQLSTIAYQNLLQARFITERKQAEEALRESEDKFRNFAEQSLVGIYLISDDVFKYVNPNFAEMFGYSVDECLNNVHFPQLVHPEDLATVEKQVGRRLSEETKAVRYSFRGIKKNGETIHVDIFGSSMVLKGKAVATGSILDVTERKQAEEALRESEAQKAAILDGISTNLAFVNENLEILWANKISADSVNRNVDEMIGHKCYELWADPNAPCDDCPTAKAFQTKKTEQTIIHSPDGRVWEEKGEPVFDEKGGLIGVLEIAHDITAKARAEEALRESEEKYRELVEETDDLITTVDRHGKAVGQK
jgi:PAS domain S-box-containing protein